MGSTYIAQMDELLAKKREQGTLGVRLFVQNSQDLTAEDIACDFCKMDEAIKSGKVAHLNALGF